MTCTAWPVGQGYLCTSLLNKPMTGGALPLVWTRVVDTGAVCFAGSEKQASREEFDVRNGMGFSMLCCAFLD
jgi:hypothetical protein